MLTSPSPGSVSIGSLAQAKAHKRKFDAVITIEDPGVRHQDRMRFHRRPHPAHLVLQFEDIDWDDLGIWVATREDVETALAFARHHVGGSLFVHCMYGIGRSTGIAFAIFADRLGPGLEREALHAVTTIRPEACPNRMVVRGVDEALGRNGALILALDKWESVTPWARARRAERRMFAIGCPFIFAKRQDRPP